MLGNLQLGTVGEWVGGLATALALWLSARTLAANASERRRRFAEQVHIVPISAQRFARGNASDEAIVVVTNTSSAPCYDIVTDLLPWDWRVDSESIQGVLIESLGPVGTTGEMKFDAGKLSPPEVGYNSVPLRLTLRDAAGRRWRRMPDGLLFRESTRRWWHLRGSWHKVHWIADS
jgi:hypothetical protein